MSSSTTEEESSITSSDSLYQRSLKYNITVQRQTREYKYIDQMNTGFNFGDNNSMMVADSENQASIIDFMMFQHFDIRDYLDKEASDKDLNQYF